MSITVELPALGESVVEGEVSRWLVQVGDVVAEDQPLVEVATDKVDAEIPAPRGGIVSEILAAVGDIVPVGGVLARIDTDASAEAPPPAAGGGSTPAAPRAPEPPPPAGSPRATPLARRVAEAEGVDVGAVAGSGPRGVVVADDVRAGGKAPPERSPQSPPPPPSAAAPPPARRRSPAYAHYTLRDDDRVIPMTPLRRLVAEHMVYSKQTSPHVGTVAEVDFGGVARVRDAHKRAFRDAHGFSLSYLPFVVHATVRALREFPRLNASVLEDAIVEKAAIHLGIAVETEKGLVVPVVRNADRFSLSGLAQAIDDLAERARNKKLSPDELQGGTFTVSNPGRQGNLYGFAIINQPQVGILRMGEIVKRPIVRSFEGDDAITIRPMMHLALSYDHRAVDGAPANGFLFRIRELLEGAEFDL